MGDNKKERPFWLVLLIFLSMLPIGLWFVAFQRLGVVTDATQRFLLTAYPFYIFAMLLFTYYLYPARKEVSWVLLVVTWLSYGALALLMMAL